MYRLYSFDGVALPDMRSEFEAGSAPAWNGAVALPGGGVAFDSLGAQQAPLMAPTIVRYSSLIKDSLVNLENTLLGWRQRVGQRATLRRRLLSAATYTDVTARLLGVSMDVQSAHSHGKGLLVEWRFQILEEFWRAVSLTTSTHDLDTSAVAISVNNPGNAPVRDCKIVISCNGKTDLTAVTVKIENVAEWTFSGTLTETDKLIVDCGQRTVTGPSGDAYGQFALTSNHKSNDWLPLAAGGLSSVVVTRTGGNVADTISFQRYAKYV